MKEMLPSAKRCTCTTGIAFCTLLLAAITTLCAFAAPTHAETATGDIVGYAYLEPDERGDYTALVLQRDARPEGQGGFISLGPLAASAEKPPWDDDRGTIRSFRVKDGPIKVHKIIG